MKKLLLILPIIVAILIAMSLVKNKQEPKRVENYEEVKKVEYFTAKKMDVPVKVEGFGEVISAKEFKLVSSVAGDVIFINEKFKNGELINKGEILIKIDSKEYLLTTKKLKADVLNLQAQIAEQKVSHERAKTTLLIEKNKFKIEQSEYQRYVKTKQYVSVSIITQQENKMLSQQKVVENLEGDLKIIPLKIEALMQTLNSAHYEYEIAQIDLKNCTITMPFSGVIYDTNAQNGEYITKSLTLAKVYDNTKMEIKVNIPVSKFKYFDNLNNIKAKAFSDSLNKYYDLSFTRVGESIDKKTRTIELVFTFNENVLKGLFLNVWLDANTLKDKVIIPRNVYKNGRVNTSFENKLVSKKVAITASQKDFYVVNGLNVGDKILLTRLVPAVEGTKLISVENTNYIDELMKVRHD